MKLDKFVIGLRPRKPDLKELPTAIPFYTKLEEQTRFKENVEKACATSILSPRNEMLPFMFEVYENERPTDWKIVPCGGGDLSKKEIDFSSRLGDLKGVKYSDGRTFAYFYGSNKGNSKKPLRLIGTYYHKIVFENYTYYSEPIIYCDMSVSEALDKFICINFRSSPSMNNLRYILNFNQKIYLDTFSHSTRIEYEEEGTNDGDNTFIPQFQKMKLYEQTSFVVPDFIKNAIHSLKLHDEITAYINGLRRQIDSVEVESEENAFGAIHTVNLDLSHTMLIKSGCPNFEVTEDDYFNTFDIADFEFYLMENTETDIILDMPNKVSQIKVLKRATHIEQITGVDLNYFTVKPEQGFVGVDAEHMIIKDTAGRSSNEFKLIYNVLPKNIDNIREYQRVVAGEENVTEIDLNELLGVKVKNIEEVQVPGRNEEYFSWDFANGVIRAVNKDGSSGYVRRFKIKAIFNNPKNQNDTSLKTNGFNVDIFYIKA